MANDISVIFLTVNKVPKKWAEFHKKTLLKAIGDTPLITISKEPLDWGTNLIQKETPSMNNIYKQVLRGSEMASTEFIAIAEDDVLYHKSHFEFRPKEDEFIYDGHKWEMLTWGKPFYYHKYRILNSGLIAPTKLVIKSLKRRFKRYPNAPIGELGKERKSGLNSYQVRNFWPEVGIVIFRHPNSLDPTEKRKTKRPGVVQAYDIKYWGKANKLRKEWK